MLRIIGGNFSGVKLKTPKGQKTRPTTDIVRESIFNMLQNIVNPGACLDLYAGSGALGIEAFSRWGQIVYLVDRSRDAITVIKENITKLHQPEAFKLYAISAQKALHKFQAEKLYFSLIFLDPPYRYQNQNQDLSQILELGLVKKGAIIVCQGDQKLEVANFANLTLLKSKKYGKTLIDIYRVEK
ncbi:MAG: 16S rRNA (guanine(966)-N(2))-methyltransferase RsmD [Lactobacillaceae bacterium]